MIGGISCTSPSPKMPAGRREQVRKLGAFGERFAARTRASAWACEQIDVLAF